ncbi:uncharacterized protein LOC117306996 isoform X2 [Asterias rubens]|uniref:uncharacterized protein LOC117306996 isoform X2 n=1 Tax=Asterias rubens TaxID=7604 RepID=UPI0014556227|nr:uncharacterized protein LOC117306996 isoform X2 [Asterias rubens]
MDSMMMSDDPSSESDTRYEMGVSHNTTVYAVGGPATTPPSLSNFTLPDPSSVPPVIDDTDRGQQTDTLASNIEEVTQAIEGEHADLLTGPERESKTYGRFKNCDICQVVMNSAAQAEMHYGGKTHQKKLRRIAEMKADSDTDEILSSGFSILPSTSSTAKGLTMPHCDICGLTFTAMSQAKMHLSGVRHAKKLRQLNLSAKEEIAVPSESIGSTQKEKEALVCTICETICTSWLQLEQHRQGSKHKSVVDAVISAEGSRLAASSSNVNSEPETNFACASCNVSTNSEQQYLQHMGSQRHRNKLLHNERESNRHRPYPTKQDALQKKLTSSNVNFQQNEKSSNTYKALLGVNTRNRKVPYGARYNNSRGQGRNFTESRTFYREAASTMGIGRNNSPYQQTRYFAGSGRGNSLSQQCRLPANRDQSDEDIYIHNDPSAVFPNQDKWYGHDDGGPNMTNSAIGDNGGGNDANNFDDSRVYSSANHMKLGFGKGSGWRDNPSW